jgi:hypothetical protein
MATNTKESSNMKLAFMGISGAGKDYLGEHLIKEYSFKRYSFSDQLKKLAVIIYPWLEEDYPAKIKEQNLNLTLSTGDVINNSPREIWLHLNMLREIENRIFIRMLDELIQSTSDDGVKRILITDVRSKEEFDWCKNNGFKILYIYPKEQIYEEYDIDKFIVKNKNQADFTFPNNFNGIDEFNQFYLDDLHDE